MLMILVGSLSSMGISDLMTFLSADHLERHLDLNSLIVTSVYILLEKHLLVHLILDRTWKHLSLSPKSNHTHASLHRLLLIHSLLVHRLLGSHTDLRIIAAPLRARLEGQGRLVLAIR